MQLLNATNATTTVAALFPSMKNTRKPAVAPLKSLPFVSSLARLLDVLHVAPRPPTVPSRRRKQNVDAVNDVNEGAFLRAFEI